MPPATYPLGANVYLANSIKSFIRAHGCQAAVITAGRITTAPQAEEILGAGQADLIGMARALLADPDLPRKSRVGREDTIVRCLYANICKQLEENYKPVRCGNLWPREFLHAPEAPGDRTPPHWSTDGTLSVVLREGRRGDVRV
jgi:hypothetical protein